MGARSTRLALEFFAILATCSLLPGQSEPRERAFLVLAKGLFPERAAALAEMRAAVRVRSGGARAAQLALGLEERMRELEALAAPWFARNQVVVRSRLWLVPAFEVEVPGSALADLASCPHFAFVQRIEARGAHTIDATHARNHAVDWVQNTLGLTGKGVALALVDSGIDFVCSGYGNNPHPAFDAAGTGQATRIRRAIDLDLVRAAPDDANGHGTQVASIAVGSKRRWSTAFGGIPDDGFAPDADLMSYRISGSQPGSADPALVIQAWQQVLLDATNPAYPPIVASVHSFGGSPSPQDAGQMAMDACSIYADVLHVTSAGNAGSFLSPTYASQSNCNGIAVGGVATVRNPGVDIHRVWSESSYGPLRFDPLRTFPDLVACCTDISSARIDAPAFMARESGTSLAAPMVAGTALVLRAADRTLSAVDTKAILLNFTQDIGAVNPNRDRNHYGNGLLRSDLAVRGAREGTILRGTLIRDIVEKASFRVRLGADRSHAATLCWQRPDPYVEAYAWANLDLRVLDDKGRVLATSNSLRNLYEKVVFASGHGREFTLEVTGSALPTAEVDFSIALGPNFSGGRMPGSVTHQGNSCAGTGIDAAAGTVLPPIAKNAWAYDHTTQPFCAGPLRLQQAFDGSDVPLGTTVTHLALRRDNEQDALPSYTVDLEVRMGYTAKDPAGLSTTFASNWIPGTETVVYANTNHLVAGARGLSYDPANFDFTIPLQTPFVAKAGKDRHLLVEFQVRSSTLASGSPPHYFDIEATRSGRYGRVVAIGSANAPSGSRDPFGLVISLVGPPYGRRAPDLQVPFAPELGMPFDVVLRHAPANAAAAILYGTQALHLRLDSLGASGCILLTDVSATLPVVVGAGGEGLHRIVLPAESGLVGVGVCGQFVVGDGGANPLGLVFTNAFHSQPGYWP